MERFVSVHLDAVSYTHLDVYKRQKYSPVAHLTYGLVGDTDILKTAPQDLIQAGYGDVVGKITAIADWDLAVKANSDYRCDTCVTLVNRALDKCFAKAEGCLLYTSRCV